MLSFRGKLAQERAVQRRPAWKEDDAMQTELDWWNGRRTAVKAAGELSGRALEIAQERSRMEEMERCGRQHHLQPSA